MSLQDYIVIKFYVPEYGIQSRPIPIKASKIDKYGWKWAVRQARDVFLAYGLKPIGEIHRSHAGLWQDGRMTYKPKLRKLTPEQVSEMIGGISPPRKKPKVRKKPKIGWKRRYRRRR